MQRSLSSVPAMLCYYQAVKKLATKHRTEFYFATQCAEPLLVLGISAVIACCTAVTGCGGNSTSELITTEAFQPSPTQSQQEDKVLAETLNKLAGLEPTADVDANRFDELRAALKQVLLERGIKQAAATPPTGTQSQVNDLRIYASAESGAICYFSYCNYGDYDQDSAVAINDLTPIGLHYNKQECECDWCVAAVADGDRNGQINISDLTPIGANFNSQIDGYILETSSSGEASSNWQEVKQVPFSSGQVPHTGGCMRFRVELTEAIVANYYRVIPCLGEERGIASVTTEYAGTPEPTFIVSGTCYSAEGNPLPNVQLTLESIGTTSSGSDGVYNFADIPEMYAGMLTPQLAETDFSPPFRVVVINGADVKTQDFTVTTVDHLESDLPQYGTSGLTVEFDLLVVDKECAPVGSFNGKGQLSSAPAGMIVLQAPEFFAGEAEARVQFNTNGAYEVSINGLQESLDGMIGTITIDPLEILHEYRIEIDPSDWQQLEWNPYSNDYYPASISINGEDFPDVQVRYRGQSARSFPKKCWKVQFPPGGQYDDPWWGYKRGALNLNAEHPDPTLMREKLAYDLMRDMGMLAPRARFGRLYVNNEYQGLYVDVENPRADWLKYFGVNNDGPLYQAQGGRLLPCDSVDELKADYEKELLEEEPFDDLFTFITELNSWSDDQVYNQLNALIDTSVLTQFMVANCLASQADNTHKNYFLYWDQHGSGKWLIIPWDHDLTWGHHFTEELHWYDPKMYYNTPLDMGSITCAWGGGTWYNMLYTRYLNDTQFTAEYHQALQDTLSINFTEDIQIARIDEYYALIHDAAVADTQKWGDNTDYDSRVEELREYVKQRREFLLNELP